MPRTDLIIDLLEKRGSREIASKSAKFRCFTHPDQGQYYWVANTGQIRVGPSVRASFSLTAQYQKHLEKKTKEKRNGL